MHLSPVPLPWYSIFLRVSSITVNWMSVTTFLWFRRLLAHTNHKLFSKQEKFVSEEVKGVWDAAKRQTMSAESKQATDAGTDYEKSQRQKGTLVCKRNKPAFCSPFPVDLSTSLSSDSPWRNEEGGNPGLHVLRLSSAAFPPDAGSAARLARGLSAATTLQRARKGLNSWKCARLTSPVPAGGEGVLLSNTTAAAAAAAARASSPFHTTDAHWMTAGQKKSCIQPVCHTPSSSHSWWGHIKGMLPPFFPLNSVHVSTGANKDLKAT